MSGRRSKRLIDKRLREEEEKERVEGEKRQRESERQELLRLRLEAERKVRLPDMDPVVIVRGGRDVWKVVLGFCDVATVCTLMQVCKSLRLLGWSNFVWERLYCAHFGVLRSSMLHVEAPSDFWRQGFLTRFKLHKTDLIGVCGDLCLYRVTPCSVFAYGQSGLRVQLRGYGPFDQFCQTDLFCVEAKLDESDDWKLVAENQCNFQRQEDELSYRKDDLEKVLGPFDVSWENLFAHLGADASQRHYNTARAVTRF